MKILKAKFVCIDDSGRNLVYSLGDSSVLLRKYGLRPDTLIRVIIEE